MLIMLGPLYVSEAGNLPPVPLPRIGVGIVKTQTMSNDTCKGCGATDTLVTKVDDAGEYQICSSCGRRQDGLGRLQDRLPF